MEITIKTQKDNPLLSRKDIEAKVTFEGATPKRADLKAEIAKVAKSTPEAVSIRKIRTAYGGIMADVTATVYKTPEDLKKFEDKGFQMKGQPRAQKAAKTK